jgi:hypothetical protein
VYVSFNEGDSWQSLRLNMPTVSVRDLVVRDDDLVIATFGRSFWILDDVTPLRQLSAQAASADVWLFRPQTAIRVRPGSDQGTPVPLDEPLGENPPAGAVLDYYLKQKSKAPVQLEIYDSEGVLVRRFASDDQIPKTNSNEVPIALEWVHDPTPLSAESGMHRFVWDLRYPLPRGLHRSLYGPAGAWAMPGNYIVKLTANGKSSSQPLVVKMDPRITTPQEALEREYRAAVGLSAALGEMLAVRQRADELQKQIAARAKESAGGGTELAASLAEFARKVADLAGVEDREGFGVYELSLPAQAPTLHKVSFALTGLLMIVESADAAPTSDAQTAIDKWISVGTETLTRWKALEADLAAVNAQLEKAKLQPLTMR